MEALQSILGYRKTKQFGAKANFSKPFNDRYKYNVYSCLATLCNKKFTIPAP